MRRGQLGKTALALFLASVAAILSVAALSTERSESGIADVAMLSKVDRGGVVVELALPNRPASVFVMPKGAVVADLLDEANVRPPSTDLIHRPLEQGDRVELSDDSIRITKMDSRRLLMLGVRIPLWGATADDLALLKGIGPKLAQKIVDYMRTWGPPQTYDELLAIPGMTRNRLAVLIEHTTLR